MALVRDLRAARHSVGSTAFLSSAIGALRSRCRSAPVLAAALVLGCGAALWGAINGFIVTVLAVTHDHHAWT